MCNQFLDEEYLQTLAQSTERAAKKDELAMEEKMQQRMLEDALLNGGKVLKDDATLAEQEKAAKDDPAAYTEPFLEFMRGNPTVYHAVDAVARRVESAGFEELRESDSWASSISRGGKYYIKRNNSSIISFIVGEKYEPGNGAAIIATHIDAIAARLKPVSTLPTKDGFVQLGVAPYASGLSGTWWDRDLGIGGRVIVRDDKTRKISSKLVKLDWPIARIPTLAEHFGIGANFYHANKETEAVPIIGLDNSDVQPPFPPSLASSSSTSATNPKPEHQYGTPSPFTATQPPRLVQLISKTLNLSPTDSILNWDLELFDTQPAQLGGLDKEFIFAGRLDDKLCSFSAVEGLLSAKAGTSPHTLSLVACFDDEEVGSLLRQGAHSNFLPNILSRILSSLPSSSSSSSTPPPPISPDLLSTTLAHSFLISADVSHSAHPNYPSTNLPHHAPRFNIGVAIQADPTGHTTTDAISSSFLQRIAQTAGQTLQVFQTRNDVRSGGTVGPMLSSALGCRALDAGLAQLSMHSIRATCGSLDPGLGVLLFRGFFEGFEEVNGEFGL